MMMIVETISVVVMTLILLAVLFVTKAVLSGDDRSPRERERESRRSRE